MEIKKVLQRKEGTKIVVVPKNSEIEAGDYVIIKKIEEVENGTRNANSS